MNSMATAMKERRRQLQQQVRETTSELRQTLQAVEVQNVELDVARKRALEASKVKSEFLANVSHEIRTPINGIVGFADLLHHSALDAEQRDYVNTIKESCANLLAIVNDILDFSKIEAGKLVIDNVAFDLRDSVEEVLSLLAPAAYGKSLELSQLIYADVPVKLYGDPIRVRQVLTNLVHNAIKFTPAGRIVVRVMLEEDGDAQCVVRLTVTDTGIGLSKEDQSKLFQAFSQADTSLTRRFGGTGLGLIISKKLLEQMGGTIGMESERGKGATFWFTLRAQKQRNVDRRDSADWLNPLSGKRMLLFDDEPLSLLSLKHLLESWHIEVTPCDSRRNLESLASADRQWDAIVLGLTRSQLGESEFKGLIPQLHRVGVPLLVMASTVDRNELRLLYQRGAAACLPKAVRRQTVFRELCRLVAPDSAAATGQPHGPSSISRPGAIRREKTVLVVDDNDINRKLVTKIALRHGARLVEAADGSEAVDACRQQRFDVIFMDIHMPGMGGEAATREIRRICKGPAGPRIIALTANAMAGERNRLLNAGMDGCLIKPITEKDVVNALFGGTAQPDQSGSDDASTGDRGAVRDELREMLLAELPQHRDSILQAFREEGHEALRLAVHKLHGAVSVCDLPDLKAACQVLEDAALNGDSDVIPEAIEELLKQLRSFSGTDDSGSSSGKRTTA
jgi:two-component system sensor histidine kinase BarA